jgi:hypothetical protein
MLVLTEGESPPGRTFHFNEFAEYVAFAKIVPSDSSPFDLNSLASVVMSASPAGVGAWLGFQAGAGGDHLLLITVPTGIFLCSAAAKLGPAAGDIVRDALRKVLELPPVAEGDKAKGAPGSDKSNIQIGKASKESPGTTV